MLGAWLLGSATMVFAQATGTDTKSGTGSSPSGLGEPIDDNSLFAHVLLDELEGRTNGPDTEFRWEGEGWAGNDFNRLWIKSEGFVSRSKVEDGDHEVFYDRPMTTYFDAQLGMRADLDSGPQRYWGAFGIEGLLPYFFSLSATGYVRDSGHLAGKLEGSYDLLLTQQLILQPQAELNFYSKQDPGRGLGTGLTDIDTGLRIRYEISRKFAPYLGMAYGGVFGKTAHFARAENGIRNDVRFVFGMRAWY
jgi:copper resistance protein B